MKQNETTKTVETGESEANKPFSAVSPLSSAQEGSTLWKPEGAPEQLSQNFYKLVRQFYPLKSLIKVCSLIADRYDYREEIHYDGWLREVMTHLSAHDPEWADRFKYFLGGAYPISEREVWSNGRICQQIYPKFNNRYLENHTFMTSLLHPIRNPKNELGSRLAPMLYKVKINKDGTIVPQATAESERFLNGELRAVPKCSLTEVIHYNRPTWGVRSEWKLFDKDQLPRRVETAKILSSCKDQKVLDDFIDDLANTFSWENDLQLPRYLGLLIQPMIAHLSPGQNPAYAILGPTKSGKGYLSSVLPGIIYSRLGEPTVQVKKMPNSTYEMEVFLGTCKNALFVCLDEIKNASDEEFKMIDAICTQEMLQTRVMRQGYFEVQNLISICMTAVHQTFSDETYGRLALIKLNESRSEAVAEFHNRWKGRGPDLLSLLFRRLAEVSFDPLKLKRVPDRRPGFSVIAHFVEAAFKTRPDYAIESTTNDILDDLCKMYETMPNLGTQKGQWRRYTPANFVDFMSSQYDRKWKRSSAIGAINTALGYRSTKNHPNYQKSGYQAESDECYHIETREEGKKTKRMYIYIREVTEIELANSQLKEDKK